MSSAVKNVAIRIILGLLLCLLLTTGVLLAQLRNIGPDGGNYLAWKYDEGNTICLLSENSKLLLSTDVGIEWKEVDLGYDTLSAYWPANGLYFINNNVVYRYRENTKQAESIWILPHKCELLGYNAKDIKMYAILSGDSIYTQIGDSGRCTFRNPLSTTILSSSITEDSTLWLVCVDSVHSFSLISGKNKSSWSGYFREAPRSHKGTYYSSVHLQNGNISLVRYDNIANDWIRVWSEIEALTYYQPYSTGVYAISNGVTLHHHDTASGWQSFRYTTCQESSDIGLIIREDQVEAIISYWGFYKYKKEKRKYIRSEKDIRLTDALSLYVNDTSALIRTSSRQIYKYNKNTNSWSHIRLDIINCPWVVLLSRIGSTFYAITNSDVLYTSNNDGLSWLERERVNTPDPVQIVGIPGSDIIFIRSEHNLYRHRMGEAGSVLITGPDVVAATVNDGHVVACTAGDRSRIMVSSDFGENWAEAMIPKEYGRTLGVIPDSGSTVLVTIKDSLVKLIRYNSSLSIVSVIGISDSAEEVAIGNQKYFAIILWSGAINICNIYGNVINKQNIQLPGSKIHSVTIDNTFGIWLTTSTGVYISTDPVNINWNDTQRLELKQLLAIDRRGDCLALYLSDDKPGYSISVDVYNILGIHEYTTVRMLHPGVNLVEILLAKKPYIYCIQLKSNDAEIRTYYGMY